MITTDTISNLCSSLTNGCLSKKTKITHINSKLIKHVLNILIKEGYIKSYKLNKNQIDIFLKYKNNKSVLTNIKKISKSSKRIYCKNKELYKNKRGFYILSTSVGLLTDIQAKNLNVGGEIICQIY